MNVGFWLRVGAAWGFLAVGMGAFGAHGLKEQIDRIGRAENFHTAAQYHMYMALALVAVGLIQILGRGGAAIHVAGWSFLAGSAIFSGTLYALSLTGQRWLGAITPIGGVLIMFGWAALAVAAGSARPTSGADREPVASSSVREY